MARIQKPRYTEDEIWANNPPDPSVDVMEPHDGDPINGVAAKKALGWTYGEKPPYNFVNWNNQHKDQMLAYLNQQGISHWDSETNYQKGSIVVHLGGSGDQREGLFYSKTDDNQGNEPFDNPFHDPQIIDPNWGYALAATQNSVAYAIDPGAAQPFKLVMTNKDGKIPADLMGLGVLTYRGGIDITQTAPTHLSDGTPVETGDIWSITNDPDATYDSTFHPLSGLGHLGEGIIAKVNAADPENPTNAEIEWYRIGAGVNNNYLLRDGSYPMTNTLILSSNNQSTSGDKAAISKGYANNTFVNVTGDTMSGNLNLDNADININSGKLKFNQSSSSIAHNIIESNKSILAKTVGGLWVDHGNNISRLVLDTNHASMSIDYDMEQNPQNYGDSDLTTKGYVDKTVNDLITWPKEKHYDATSQDQTDFVIPESDTSTFDPNKVQVYVEGILQRRGSNYNYDVQPYVFGGYKIVFNNGLDLGSWVYIQYT